MGPGREAAVRASALGQGRSLGTSSPRLRRVGCESGWGNPEPGEKGSPPAGVCAGKLRHAVSRAPKPGVGRRGAPHEGGGGTRAMNAEGGGRSRKAESGGGGGAAAEGGREERAGGKGGEGRRPQAPIPL